VWGQLGETKEEEEEEKKRVTGIIFLLPGKNGLFYRFFAKKGSFSFTIDNVRNTKLVNQVLCVYVCFNGDTRKKPSSWVTSILP
jgi:hypothetical protein